MSQNHLLAAAFLIGMAALCAAGGEYAAALLAGVTGLCLGAVGALPRRRKRGEVEMLQLRPYVRLSEFCGHCGASIPPRNGEGRCEKCAPIASLFWKPRRILREWWRSVRQP